MNHLKSFWKYLRSSDTSKWHMRILIILTLLLFIISGIGRIPGIIEQPQFTSDLSRDFITALFKDNLWLKWSYHLFFIIDTLWAPILLLAMFKFVKRCAFKEKSPPNYLGFSIYALLVILAYIADCIENFQYFFNYNYIKALAYTKIFLYVFVILVWLTIAVMRNIKSFLPALINFLKSAAISLVILLVIGISLPETPQVNSIVVNLYNYPVNFVFLLLFAPIYAVVLAHYPSYFNIEPEHRKWYRAKNSFLLLGIIFYKHKDDDLKRVERRIEGIINFMFRTLGVVFYAALFYMIAYTSEINFDWPVAMSKVALSLLALGIYILYRQRKVKTKWLNENFMYLYHNLPNFYDGDFNPNDLNDENRKTLEAYIKNDEEIARLKILIDKAGEGTQELIDLEFQLAKVREDKEEILSKIKEPKTLYNIRKQVKWYIYLIILIIITHGLLFFLFIINPEHTYTYGTAILSLTCIALQMLTFVYYRTFRSVFRFTFYAKKIRAVLNAFYVLRPIKVVSPEKEVTQDEIDEKEEKIFTFFKDHDFVKKNWLFRVFRYLCFGVHSNNITFLQFTVLIGLINTLFLIWINFSSDATLIYNINAFLIIISAFFFYYGVIVVITKNFIYYKYSLEKYANKYKKTFFGAIGVCFMLLIFFNTMGRLSPNNLFTLQPIEQTNNEPFTLNQYVDGLPKDNNTRYYIGSYGGGMKANAWTLTVLNDLYNHDPDFFRKTIGISGASGGTIGLINMSAIIGDSPNDNSNWQEKITAISTENILSLDLTHILGRDTFSYMLIPGFVANMAGEDRSTKAMMQYANIAHSDKCDYENKSYRDYWKTIYDNYGKAFPILISNTTNVKGNQGMAVSVKVVEESPQESLLYHGADNILDLNTKTLTYYDAASTSNRFPGISPAAKIETLGHFNDGGIYDNSGLLSVYKLFRAINNIQDIKDLDSLNHQTVFINIVNDKNAYIKHFIKTNAKKLKVSKINEDTEISAILNSIFSTEMMPIFIKTELDRLSKNHANFDFKTIYLPHRFTVEDVKSIIGKELLAEGSTIIGTNKLLYDCTKKNDSIIKALITRQSALKYTPVIEPPMSRVMAAEAYKFMQYMLEHEITKAAIDSIVKY